MWSDFLPVLDDVTHTMISLAVAAAVLRSAWSKLRHRRLFLAVLYTYRLLPEMPCKALAWMIPIAEACSALTLPFAATQAAAATLICALALMFALALAINIARGNTEINCGCQLSQAKASHAFKQQPDTSGIGGLHVARACLLAGLAALIHLPQVSRSWAWFDYFACCMGSAIILLMLSSFDVLLLNSANEKPNKTVN